MKIVQSIFLLCFVFSSFVQTSSATETLKLDYDGFTVWVSCEKRGAVMFRYNAQRDNGHFKRVKNFSLDNQVPARCQQTSTNTYRAPGQRYDRGHMTPANHLDHSKKAIYQSNFMTNVWPQAANMNRGSWLHTEEITECYRDIDELLVFGGPLWLGDTSNDFFIKTHGIKTPDAFWKVIVRNDKAIAWIIPNSQDATRDKLDQYLVSIKKVEAAIGLEFPVPDYLKEETPSTSWYIPRGCNKG